MSVWPVLLALFFVGCEKTPAVDVRPTDPSRAADGVVHLPSASLKFIRVEEVGAATAAGGLRAPAKLAFRENALSRVGARLAGRVVRVHIKTGDTVRVGAPLVTLDCLEA